MSSEQGDDSPDENAPSRPRVRLAIPAGPLRRRLLAALEAADVDVDVDAAPGEDLVEQVRGSDADIVLVDPSQVDDVDALAELAASDDGAGIAIVGEHAPGERANLLAAGIGGIVNARQDERELAASLEALVDAEASAGVRGPEVGGSGADPRIADFLTRSPRMREFVAVVRKVIDADTTLLLLGDTGVGKEHLARAIHAESHRSDGPFVAVNCAALPEQLLEAELFGHVKGAFTGAEAKRQGHFQLADGGTLLLDEIGDLPLHLQAKLLTALQRHEVTPVGGDRPVRVDVRVMVATNKDLEAAVRDGTFREDLYYRLNVVALRIPSLRDRPEDIPDLAGRFIHHFRSAMNGCEVDGISDAAIDALQRHDWPGNVRELVNVIERAMLFCESTQIAPSDLQLTAATTAVVGNAQPAAAAGADAVALDVADKTLRDVRDDAIAAAEEAYLRAVLTETEGHLGRTAERAGLSARALYGKMKRYGLRKEDYRP